MVCMHAHTETHLMSFCNKMKNKSMVLLLHLDGVSLCYEMSNKGK